MGASGAAKACEAGVPLSQDQNVYAQESVALLGALLQDAKTSSPKSSPCTPDGSLWSRCQDGGVGHNAPLCQGDLGLQSGEEIRQRS